MHHLDDGLRDLMRFVTRSARLAQQSPDLLCALQAKQTGNPRDYYLTRKDINNAKGDLEKTSWRLHSNDAQSVRMYTQKYPDRVLLYQEQKLHKGADVMLQKMAAQRRDKEAAAHLQSAATMSEAPCSTQPMEDGAAGVQRPSAADVAVPLEPGSEAADENGQPQSSQWQPRKVQDGYFSDFILGLTRPELMHLLVQHGHHRHMSIDATHSTNRAKV